MVNQARGFPELAALFPFTPHFLPLPYLSDGPNHLHYVDEGQGEVILCLHGNPTWSFFYRHVIQELRKSYRVIALDHLGCGVSSKPQNYSYRLADHIENLTYFIKTLGLEQVTLVLHDWGGAIGLGWATRFPEQVKRLVLLNTAAFYSEDIPRRIALCKVQPFGEWAMRHANMFARAALVMATHRGLRPEVKKGLIRPYDNYENRIAIARFVQDIPQGPDHPTYSTLKDIEAKLPLLQGPKMLLWGMRDFCFHPGFLAEWQRIFPDAQVGRFLDAGHYLLEDEPTDTVNAIARFLTQGA